MKTSRDDSRGAPWRRVGVAALLTSVLVTTGCVQGHRVLRPSHAGHNQAVQDRINEELLLNLVRLRYRDSPLFLRIGSVVVQFQLSASATAGASIQESGRDSLSLGTGVGVREEPTFTFTPLQDEEFVRRLLRPIDVDVTMLLQRSGWSIDRVMRLTTQSMNGLDNAPSASGPTPERAPAFEDFRRATAALRELQIDGAVALGYAPRTAPLAAPVDAGAISGGDLVAAAREGYRFEAGTDGTLVLTGTDRRPMLLLAPGDLDDPEARAFIELLGLEPGRSSYDLQAAASELRQAGEDRGRRGSIVLAQRSLLGALFYLGQGIDVPRPHVEAGLVTVTVDADGRPFDWTRVTGDLLRVRSAPSRPSEAAVAVPYRGHWFYVEDSDLGSKSTFALLVKLFALQSSSSSSGDAPVLTLPVGG